MENPFPYSDSNKRYHTWDYHLRQKFGGKVFKIALDGGFSCPNIDGTWRQRRLHLLLLRLRPPDSGKLS